MTKAQLFRLAALCAAGSASVVFGAMALQAKPKDKPSAIAVPDAFRIAARDVRAAIDAGDLAGADARVAALQPTSPLESYIVAGLRMEVASKRGDPQGQRKALTDMLESKAVPAGQEPWLRYLAGYYSYFLGEFDDAIAQVNYARQLGYTPIETTVLLADANLKKGRRAEGMTLLSQAVAEQRAAGKTVPASWYDRAISFSYQMGNWNDVARWYQEKLAAYPGAENWRTGISNYLAAPGVDPQVQLDLYRLLAATGAMASERDFQAYATLAQASGYDAEAKAIIEAGRSSGKLTPTDAVTVGMMKTLTPKAKKALAALPAQATKAASASTGAAAMAVGDSYFSLGQYPQAATQYRLALSKGGVDADRVNVRLGIALARSGDLPSGKAALAQAGGNWANTARFWTVWTDQQAQPIVQSASAPPAPVSLTPSS